MRRGTLLASIVAVLVVVCASALAASSGLKFVQTKVDGVGPVDGVTEPDDVATCGGDVYVTGGTSDSVAAFSTSKKSGKLTFIKSKFDGVGGVSGLDSPNDLVCSRDGSNVYVAASSSNAVTTFDRNAKSGKLTFVNKKTDGGDITGLDGAYAVTVSGDGRSVYVTGSSSIVVFKRSRSTGKLSYVQTKTDGVGGVHGLGDPNGVIVSPDRKNVYVTASTDNDIAIFKRSSKTGKLKYLGKKTDGSGGVDGLEYPFDMAISPNGKSVYVNGSNDDAVVTFSRSSKTGKLKFVNAKKNPPGSTLEPLDSLVTKDGRRVYTAFYDQGPDHVSRIQTFKRSRKSGKLTKLGSIGVKPSAIGLWRIAMSGKFIYSANYDGSSTAVFKRK